MMSNSGISGLFIDRERELRGFRKLLKPEAPKAVMIVEAEELMGKTWLIHQMDKCCREEMKGAPIVAIDFKDEYERHTVQGSLSLIRLIQGKLGHPEYFEYLNRVIRKFVVVRRSMNTAALMPLIESIEANYDLRSLERLSMWLNLVWENLAGDTLFQKAKELVMHYHRSGDYTGLMERLEKDRPNVDWRRTVGPLPERTSYEHGDISDAQSDQVMDIIIPAEGRELAEAQINKAFIICLQQLLTDVKPIVFLFDGCEEVPDEAERWIREQLLDLLVQGELQGVIMIFAARKVPYRLDVEGVSVAVKTTLDGFDEIRAQEFFEAYGLQVNAKDLPILVASSGGQPGMLARMVDNLRAQRDKEDPFFQ
jgi:hypothetical protein